MQQSFSRGALARLVFVACGFALLLLIAGGAHARGRGPMTDDGGRLMRVGSSIIAEAERFLGMGNVTGARGPWCSDFASLVLRRTGHRPLANRTAGSALSYGPHVARPKPGDLVVLGGRRGASHVGFVVADHGAMVRFVSGNWSRKVSLGEVRRSHVIAFVHV